MNDNNKKRLELTQQIMSDLRSVWQPYKPRVLPADHTFWKDVSPESRQFYPERGQAEIGQAILSGKYDLVVVELARQTGKSSLLNALPWYKGLLNPASSIYYFAPYRKQVRDFIWNKQKAQTMNAMAAVDMDGNADTEILKRFQANCHKYIKGKPNNDEMMITWQNNSQFLIDGADNIDVRRGVTADLVILDEVRDMKPGVFDTMLPSIKVKRGCIVAISSSAHSEGEFTRLVKMAKDPNNPKSKYFKAPSWMNPYQDLEDLERTRESYVRLDELDVWQREYCSEQVIGGSRSIFPMIKGNEQVPHGKVMKEVNEYCDLEYHCVCDPGSADKGSEFAVLFAAFHPYTRQIYLLDEIYATKEEGKSTGKVEPRIDATIRELTPHLSREDWNFTYDEAASWFRNEMQDRGYAFHPTQKRKFGKDAGISTIKDAWVSRHVIMSTRCKNLMHEFTQYVRDDKGRIPNKLDHLIDALRYFLVACNYHISQDDPDRIRFSDRDRPQRGFSVEDDLRKWGSQGILDEEDDFMNEYLL